MDFKAEDKPIKEILFSNKKYQIPIYQRPYAWAKDEMEDFWIDLTKN